MVSPLSHFLKCQDSEQGGLILLSSLLCLSLGLPGISASFWIVWCKSVIHSLVHNLGTKAACRDKMGLYAWAYEEDPAGCRGSKQAFILMTADLLACWPFCPSPHQCYQPGLKRLLGPNPQDSHGVLLGVSWASAMS